MTGVGLRVSADLSLPTTTVTDAIAVLGMRGTGKTYAALVLAEEMFEAGVPFVVLDPVGVAWGLRSSADGKKPGYPVTVLGGAHADAPLEPAAGRVIAQFVVDERAPLVIDFTGFGSKAEQLRFTLDFLTELYRKNREPLHVIVDEADDLAPQRSFGEEARVLRATEVLVRRGRARGLGCTLISQRAAVLNKNVLTQCDTLVVGRTVSPQDRKALESWVNAHATEDEKRKFMNSLATLEDEEKWIWAPYRKVFERVTIRERRTFDSSATPKLSGKRSVARVLAPVDLDSLRSRIAETIERARQEDPKALRERVRELEKSLLKAGLAGKLPNLKAVEIEKIVEKIKIVEKEVPFPVLRDEQIAAISSAAAEIRQVADVLVEASERLAIRDVNKRSSELSTETDTSTPAQRAQTNGVYRSTRSQEAAETRRRRSEARHLRGLNLSPLSGSTLSAPERRILDSVAWWQAAGVAEPSRHQVAFGARYTVNGHFNNVLRGLREKLYVDYPSGDHVSLSDSGMHCAVKPEVPASREELVARAISVLHDEPSRRIFEVVAGRPDHVFTREELGATCTPPYTVNGHFNNVLRSLRAISLVDYPRAKKSDEDRGGGHVTLGSMFRMGEP